MIIQCPTCDQGYDITDYPPNARFACRQCEQIIQAIDATASSEVLSAPPMVAPASPTAHSHGSSDAHEFDNSTRRLTPVRIPTQAPTEPPTHNAASSLAPPTKDDPSADHDDFALASPLDLQSPEQELPSTEQPQSLAQAEDTPSHFEVHVTTQAFDDSAEDSLYDDLDDIHQPPPGIERTIRARSPLLTQPKAQVDPTLSDPAESDDDLMPPTRADLSLPPEDSLESFIAEATGDIDEQALVDHDDESPVETTTIASQADLQASARSEIDETLASHAEDFDLDAMLADEEQLQEAEGTGEVESTSIGVNPLLNAQAFLDDMEPLDDPLAQQESTMVSKNPLLQNLPQHAQWEAPIAKMPQPNQRAYHTPEAPTQAQVAQQEIDMAAQTAYEIPKVMAPTPPEEPANNVYISPALSAQESQQTQAQQLATDKFTRPSSWENLDASKGESDDPSLMVPQTDNRAIAGVLLLITFVLGPICLLLGWSAFQRIRQRDSAFRGKTLALLAMIGGALETFALGTLLVLFLLFPQGHPALAFVVKTLQSFQLAPPRVDFHQMKPQPARLELTRARRLLRDALQQQAGLPTLKHIYVYQEPQARHAFVHWRHPLLKRHQRSLFLYSNRNHWHLATLYSGKGFEVRCATTTGDTLSALVARALIQSFWKVRGRFSGVRIAQLYVAQQPGRHTAHAYWTLTKQVPNTAIRQWKVKSLFHRSNSGRWYLSRYAIKIPKDELFSHEKAGGPSLTPDLGKELLEEHHKDHQQNFAPGPLYVYQEAKQRRAFVHWQNGRNAQRTLFRYTNANKWILARLDVKPGYIMAYQEKGEARLQRAIVQKLLQRYMRRNTRKLLLKTFATQGQKGKPPRRLPAIQQMYIYQPSPQHALARWQATFPKSFAFVESELHRAPSGEWYLSRFDTERAFDVRFSQTSPGPITVALAKDLIQQFWQKDVRSEKFTGARLEALYVFQEKNTRLAWAHWRKQQGGQITRMRTLFFRSNQGRWYLGTYDSGLGYLLADHAPGPQQFDDQLAAKLLKQHLKSQARYQHAQLSEPYVYQPPGSSHAYVAWRLEDTKQSKATYLKSLFHRSNDGHWYLSILSTPQINMTP